MPDTEKSVWQHAAGQQLPKVSRETRLMHWLRANGAPPDIIAIAQQVTTEALQADGRIANAQRRVEQAESNICRCSNRGDWGL